MKQMHGLSKSYSRLNLSSRIYYTMVNNAFQNKIRASLWYKLVLLDIFFKKNVHGTLFIKKCRRA
jgi:hypothetical protein